MKNQIITTSKIELEEAKEEEDVMV